jgi:hypothetical protein
MNIYSVNNPRLYSITGNLRTEDGRIDSTRMAIYVIDANSGDTLIYTAPTEDGAFAFRLKQGIYELHFMGEGYEELIRPIQITSGSNKLGITLVDNIVLPLVKEEPELFEGDESQIKLKVTQVEEVAGIPIVIPVIAPKGSTLVVRTYQDSVLVSTDTLVTEKRRTGLQIIPLPGTSEVELELTDKEGNIHRNRLLVIGSLAVDIDSQENLEQMPGDEQPIIPDELLIEDPDLLLSESIARGDAELLLQHLKEQSDGPLKAYLDQLDLEAEGISASQDLLIHLDRVADKENFSMDDVRKAMLESLEIRGMSKIEIEQVLRELLGDQHSGSDSTKNKAAWPLLVLLVVAGVGLVWFIIIWWRRREKREKQGD